MPAPMYECGIDAEPLNQYRPGGYHPLVLGEALNGGRYKIIHKLGWGSYSTTWAAKDQKNDRYVAVKVRISETQEAGELKILRALSPFTADHLGSTYVNRMLDHFTLVGPNGSHNCLVLEIVGPNVADFVDSHFKDGRLPPELAKAFAKQMLQGVDFLAANNIGHGDLHARNLALVVPDLDSLSEEDFVAKLGQPETRPVIRSDGGPLGNDVPAEMVYPAFFQKRDLLKSSSIKIIDFGEAFLSNDPPSTLHTPLPVRAPEVIFMDRLDRRVDLWSAGCLIFELIAEHPPFDAIMATPPTTVKQMIALASDKLPPRWQAQWNAMQKDMSSLHDYGDETVLQSLEDAYFFDPSKNVELTRDELVMVADAIALLLKLEPSLRASPSDVLAAGWFR
ncbi:hypothetical protein BST61_g9943 [Cercospora zeina]